MFLAIHAEIIPQCDIQSSVRGVTPERRILGRYGSLKSSLLFYFTRRSFVWSAETLVVTFLMFGNVFQSLPESEALESWSFPVLTAVIWLPVGIVFFTLVLVRLLRTLHSMYTGSELFTACVENRLLYSVLDERHHWMRTSWSKQA